MDALVQQHGAAGPFLLTTEFPPGATMQFVSRILYKDAVGGLTFYKVRFRPRADLPDKWCLEGVLKDKYIRDYERRRRHRKVTVLLAIRADLDGEPVLLLNIAQGPGVCEPSDDLEGPEEFGDTWILGHRAASMDMPGVSFT